MARSFFFVGRMDDETFFLFNPFFWHFGGLRSWGLTVLVTDAGGRLFSYNGALPLTLSQMTSTEFDLHLGDNIFRMFDSTGQFYHIPIHDTVLLSECLRRRTIGLFLKLCLITQQFADTLLCWRHSGFSVDNSVRLDGGDHHARQALAHSTRNSAAGNSRESVWKYGLYSERYTQTRRFQASSADRSTSFSTVAIVGRTGISDL
jgi:hypothetical protein